MYEPFAGPELERTRQEIRMLLSQYDAIGIERFPAGGEAWTYPKALAYVISVVTTTLLVTGRRTVKLLISAWPLIKAGL